MTDPNQPPQYVAPPMVYQTVRRPPLTPREKRGAFWAGAVGFNVLTIGFTLVIVPVAVALFGAFFTFLTNMIARNSDELSTGFLAMLGVMRSIDVGLVAVIGIAIVLVGLAIMAGAIFLSRSVLRSHGVNRPAAVTWAGAGVAIAATWVLGWIPGLITQFVSFPLSAMEVDGVTSGIVMGIFGVLLGVVFAGVIGWLAWWWMAHAFRPATREVPVVQTAIQE